MINLLDPAQQRQLRAARLNVRLLRFVALSLFVVLSVGLVYGVGFWMAFNDRNIATAEHNASEAELAQYEQVAKDAATYRQNLATAKQILGNGIVFSTFLTDVGTLMPANTIIDSLSISTAKSSVPQTAGNLSFTTRGKSYNDILQTKHAFETSTVFSNVQIIKTATSEKRSDKGITATYPYEATFQVTVNALKGTTK